MTLLDAGFKRSHGATANLSLKQRRMIIRIFLTAVLNPEAAASVVKRDILCHRTMRHKELQVWNFFNMKCATSNFNLSNFI